MNIAPATPSDPSIERMRLEPVRRNLTVSSVERITPKMLRLVLAGDELTGFHSPSPDDHIKVILTAGPNAGEKRDYTPRRFDSARNTLAVDFFLHDSGAVSTWAETARAGDPVQIGGPRGSSVVSAPGAWWLLLGDEAALPSIGRRLEELPEGTPVQVVAAVTGPEEEQRFTTRTNLTARWLHRPAAAAADAAPWLEALRSLQLPVGPGFVWIAAESGVARVIREYVIGTLNHPAEWIKSSGYWTQGEADSHTH